MWSVVADHVQRSYDPKRLFKIFASFTLTLSTRGRNDTAKCASLMHSIKIDCPILGAGYLTVPRTAHFLVLNLLNVFTVEILSF